MVFRLAGKFKAAAYVCTPPKGKVQKKEGKKLTNVSFMYVCVAENGEMFFSFFSPTIV